MDRNIFIAIAITATASGCGLLESEQIEPPRVVEAPVVVAEPTIPDTFPIISFESGGLSLSIGQRHVVREIAAQLKSPTVSDLQVNVTGHTDHQGDASNNEKVGLLRAKAVARELVFNGVLSERLKVDSRGEREPIAPNTHDDGKDNPAGRAQNRRVEISLER